MKNNYTNMLLHLIHSLMKNQGNLERERDELRVEIDKYKNKLEVSERTIQHLKKTLDEKVFENNLGNCCYFISSL